ncbi:MULTISPECIES: hypothetical protein [unclassified Pseudoclavibacter]|nr:hypothetical protein [Pseudoclavibacter sp. Marseille-Q4354]
MHSDDVDVAFIGEVVVFEGQGLRCPKSEVEGEKPAERLAAM